MQCDPQQGCMLPHQPKQSANKPSHLKPADIIFVTDPICSHCWAIEPMWRRLHCEYQFTTRYIHGGLLPGWEGFGDAGNGISGPLDVIAHWQHVADVYQQPIDPSVWRDDPISNSYILCKAALVVRQLAPSLESQFVRMMRERIFLYAENLSNELILRRHVEKFGFDEQAFFTLLHSAQISSLFKREQHEMTALGARGFPSLIFLSDNPTKLVGSVSYHALEEALSAHNNPAIKPLSLSHSEKLLRYNSWTMREATEVLQCAEHTARNLLLALGFSVICLADIEFWQQN